MNISSPWQLIIIICIVIFIIWSANSLAKQNKRTYKVIRNITERKCSHQLRIINRYRKNKGLRPLHAYYEMDKIAKGHSYYMAKHRSINHNGFDSRAMAVRTKTHSSNVGENCIQYPAKTYNNKVAEKLVETWMKSPGHRKNLMNPLFSKIGIGIVVKRGQVYGVQIFAG